MKAPRFGHDDAAAAVWRAAGAYGWRPLPPCVEVRAWSAPVVITRDALDAAPVLDLAEHAAEVATADAGAPADASSGAPGDASVAAESDAPQGEASTAGGLE